MRRTAASFSLPCRRAARLEINVNCYFVKAESGNIDTIPRAWYNIHNNWFGEFRDLRKECFCVKRKAIAILLALVLCMSVCLPAFADGASTYCLKKEDNYQRAVQIINSANRRILICVRTAQLTPYDDVDWMLRTTRAIANEAKSSVRRLGYETTCEYTSYYVDGRWVEVDPLHVYNPLPSKPDPKPETDKKD